MAVTQSKQTGTSRRCPYYSLAEGGVYGSLGNTSDWSTQYWGALADSTLLGAGCPVAQSSLPAKYQACLEFHICAPVSRNCKSIMWMPGLWSAKTS